MMEGMLNMSRNGINSELTNSRMEEEKSLYRSRRNLSKWLKDNDLGTRMNFYISYCYILLENTIKLMRLHTLLNIISIILK